MVRFLHITETPILRWVENEGKDLIKPRGFWMARDLEWAALLDRLQRRWSRLRPHETPVEPKGRILAAYEHVFAGRTVPAPAEGETVTPLNWNPHYVYEVNLANDRLTSDIHTPNRAHIFQLSRKNFDAFLAAYEAFKRNWAETRGPDASITKEVLTDALTKGADLDKDAGSKRIETIRTLLKAPKQTIKAIADSREHRARFLKAVVDGDVTLRLHTSRQLTSTIWAAFTTELGNQWGGIEFTRDLFTESGDNDEELVKQAPILYRLDVPSTVLFDAGAFLKTDPPLRAILAGLNVPVDAPPGIPVYRFGINASGELRAVSSGGRRRRTRRRVFKNPKTLKKRIR